MLETESFRLIRTFVAVVEEKSFAGAAERLRLTPSAVSKHIAELEQQLGVRLIQRTTRSQSLTEAGDRYYRRCAPLLDELDAASQEVASSEQTPRGRLRITAPTLLGQAFVTPALAAFQRAYPDISVELLLEDRAVDLIEEAFDVAIRSGAQLPSSSLVAKKLARHEFVLCASGEYVAEHGLPRRPADLVRHRCVVRQSAERGEMWTLVGPEGTREIRVNGPFASNSRYAIFHATLAGAGIGMLPHYLVGDALAKGELVRILPQYRSTERFVYAVYPHRNSLPARLRVFLDFIATRATEVLERA